MEIYVITKEFMELSDGYYDEKTKRPIYKRKYASFETMPLSFVSYVNAAKYIRKLIEEDNKKFDNMYCDEDMNKWNVFFIGFHHECTVHYKSILYEEKYYNAKNMPAPSKIVKYKIETIELNTEIVNETTELLKELI